MIRIVTDSTGDLPGDVAQAHGIEVVPLYIHFGNQIYRDGELSHQQFFDRLKRSPALPTTSQPAAGDFLGVYKRLAAGGDAIISIHLSSLLSGTCASAYAARDMLGAANIHVVDTLTISACQGWIAVQAAQMARAGQPLEAILERLDFIKRESRLYLTVDTLEYLHKGGRIGGAQALLGTLLQMKPILMLQAGRVEPCERVRTRAKAVARMKEIAIESVTGRRSVHLAILHAACPEEAQALRDELSPQIECLAEASVIEIGPVIAVHAGPGALGVTFWAE